MADWDYDTLHEKLTDYIHGLSIEERHRVAGHIWGDDSLWAKEEIYPSGDDHLDPGGAGDDSPGVAEKLAFLENLPGPEPQEGRQSTNAEVEEQRAFMLARQYAAMTTPRETSEVGAGHGASWGLADQPNAAGVMTDMVSPSGDSSARDRQRMGGM